MLHAHVSEPALLRGVWGRPVGGVQVSAGIFSVNTPVCCALWLLCWVCCAGCAVLGVLCCMCCWVCCVGCVVLGVLCMCVHGYGYLW